MNDKTVCHPKIFKKIFDTFAEDLHHYLYYKFGDLIVVDDIVQETFIRLWKNCANVLESKARGFLFRVATNLFIDKKRHDKIVLHYKVQATENIENETPEFLMQEKEFMLKLQQTIASLPDKQREVFLLNRIDKKTYKEISKLLGISIKAVEKRMHNALLIVRTKIGKV